jgi:hypothetical protein
MCKKAIEIPLASLTIAASLGFSSIFIQTSPSMAQRRFEPPRRIRDVTSPRRVRDAIPPGRIRGVPGPVPLAGALAVVCWSRQLRRKCVSKNSIPD